MPVTVEALERSSCCCSLQLPLPAAYPPEPTEEPEPQKEPEQTTIIGSRHNHYSRCVAAAELLMTQCLSGCACQVSLTTVACEGRGGRGGRGGKLKSLLGNRSEVRAGMVFRRVIHEQSRADAAGCTDNPSSLGSGSESSGEPARQII
ncbi:hypothetical protein GOODEAATRI_026430 [Goodea atripinnis]|uniref:Uncharacterized protein n=1 Tax=Goodea atripinnis TaxID=208336 RepID=A0ABV0MVC2_9TELE